MSSVECELKLKRQRNFGSYRDDDCDLYFPLFGACLKFLRDSSCAKDRYSYRKFSLMLRWNRADKMNIGFTTVHYTFREKL